MAQKGTAQPTVDLGGDGGPMTAVEAFAQFHANESGSQISLVRHFSPVTGHPVAPDGLDYWLLVQEGGTEWATIVSEPGGEIVRFEFNYEHGAGPSPVPFLIATIDWLTRGGSPEPERQGRHSSTPGFMEDADDD